jgi:hypothetical protein
VDTYPPSGFTVDAFLCDSAVVAEGKLYIQGGGWNMLTAASFPFVQSRIGVAVIIGVPYTATNRSHTFELRLLDQDGQPVPIGPVVGTDETGALQRPSGVAAQFNLGRPSLLRAGDAQNLPFAINLDQLPIESPGAYSFVLGISGQEIERLTFRVQPA